ncbi:ribosomal protein S18 acetylase RimI-like enzyme [Microbacterium endophyticum]|uniref:Ribosomal protein S18 acetylase RimI-like enzyme n=1 Tax=Microbacterium endophyticum TaxID=1526412 RepID=A0A7W4YLS5_9MICO|nr:GNAT family N-acetyltransferase [Microbacterium endophyticum]MBB2975473.1 ribosomal protein S18 acetylase RimI-like enzyme [Microbacterium endophyticum]NIK35508.1 ribosomal protein S18 acetylase RimI-like enzyme [Microbacterium endophyticum]
MEITLVPISAQQFPSWRKQCYAEYAADLIAAGEAPPVADQHAADSLERAFPIGAPTADNAVFNLVHDTHDRVGYLWIGRDTSGDPTAWWVWDILVEPEYRGKGYGRAAIRLAEGHARGEGARSLGLSVFGHNGAARALYESLGFETTTVKMRKQL